MDGNTKMVSTDPEDVAAIAANSWFAVFNGGVNLITETESVGSSKLADVTLAFEGGEMEKSLERAKREWRKLWLEYEKGVAAESESQKSEELRILKQKALEVKLMESKFKEYNKVLKVSKVTKESKAFSSLVEECLDVKVEVEEVEEETVVDEGIVKEETVVDEGGGEEGEIEGEIEEGEIVKFAQVEDENEHLANVDVVARLLKEVIKKMLSGVKQQREEEELEKEGRRGSLRSGNLFRKGNEVSLKKVSRGKISKLKAPQHKFLSSKAPRVMISKLKAYIVRGPEGKVEWATSQVGKDPTWWRGPQVAELSEMSDVLKGANSGTAVDKEMRESNVFAWREVNVIMVDMASAKRNS